MFTQSHSINQISSNQGKSQYLGQNNPILTKLTRNVHCKISEKTELNGKNSVSTEYYSFISEKDPEIINEDLNEISYFELNQEDSFNSSIDFENSQLEDMIDDGNSNVFCIEDINENFHNNK